MGTRRGQAHWRDRAAGLALAVALVALLGGAPAQAARSAPQLSIAIDNGQSAVRAGDTVTYAIVVTNVGTKAVKGLWLSQSLPTGLRFMSSDSEGVTERGVVSWRVDLAASANATVHSTMRVTVTPTDLLRLASVACASSTRIGRPIVCASHSDQLPAGAAAVEAESGSGSQSSGVSVWWYAVGAALVVVVGLVVLRRRRSAGMTTA
jgi:uncharacterized repeat protein (TIGR01451 family)